MLERLILVFILLSSCLLSGCYLHTTNPAAPPDPLQSLNRDTNRLNSRLDKILVKPVAQAYSDVVPYVARKSVSNFFDNLDEPADVANDLMQGDGRWALNDLWRFVFNTSIGLGGIFDPASHMGLQAHSNDFGLTLNRWGIYSAYFVVPFLGPRTIGNTVSIPVDYYLGASAHYIPLRYSVILDLVYGLNARAGLLSSEKTARGLIFDRYTFFRSAYLQRRAYLLKINHQGPYNMSETTVAQAQLDELQGVYAENS
jgi:phospholipid-binding lipoprotein MlaA